MKKYPTTKSGFSLVEALVSLFIFSLVSVMIVGTFSGFFKSFMVAKKQQKSMESAQYAINLMAKTIRTSDVVTIPKGIRTFDYSQSVCIEYWYSGVNNIKKRINTSAAVISLPTCAAAAPATWPAYTDLTPIDANTGLGDISNAYFDVVPSASGSFGKVSISLNVQGATPTSVTSPIQMSVSLRQ